MQIDRLTRIESLWEALRRVAQDGGNVQPVIEGLRMEYDCALREAQAFGFGDGFARGQDAGREEGLEVGLREGRADAAHHLCLRFVSASAEVIRGETAEAPPTRATAVDRDVETLADLELRISEGRAPVH